MIARLIIDIELSPGTHHSVSHDCFFTLCHIKAELKDGDFHIYLSALFLERCLSLYCTVYLNLYNGMCFCMRCVDGLMQNLRIHPSITCPLTCMH